MFKETNPEGAVRLVRRTKPAYLSWNVTVPLRRWNGESDALLRNSPHSFAYVRRECGGRRPTAGTLGGVPRQSISFPMHEPNPREIRPE